MPEASDYIDDIKKYAPAVNEKAVAALVKHLGIALTTADGKLVAASDAKERAALRDGFLKKKLKLKQTDAELDAEMKIVFEKMKGVRRKSRVTVCYLMAEHFGKLDAL